MKGTPAPSFTISLLTDYGLDDGFVGALPGVIRRRAPKAPVIDITHGIKPQDVRAGALALKRALPYLPAGAVVAVVDPGVATSRRAVAVAPTASELVLIGPDNGLLPPAFDTLPGPAEAVELEDRGYWLAAPGPTFAGRDIFAPAAAALATGATLSELGSAIDPASLVRLPAPVCRAHWQRGVVEAEATWVDHFGNVQLAAGPDLLPAREAVEVSLGPATWRARVVRAFAELAAGELGLVTDSYGQLALTFNGASAASRLGAKEQDIFVLKAPSAPPDAPAGGPRPAPWPSKP
jgi:S-adenosylmethionine hydrolase